MYMIPLHGPITPHPPHPNVITLSAIYVLIYRRTTKGGGKWSSWNASILSPFVDSFDSISVRVGGGGTDEPRTYIYIYIYILNVQSYICIYNTMFS